jgi:hypothetical protein
MKCLDVDTVRLTLEKENWLYNQSNSVLIYLPLILTLPDYTYSFRLIIN